MLDVYKRQEYLSEYFMALDAGWHLAPTAGSFCYDPDFGNARTVILAQTLSESSLLQALRQRRAYATQDADLRLEFQLNGADMGGFIKKSETPELTARFQDETCLLYTSVFLSPRACQTSVILWWMVSAPVGHTTRHWPQPTQLVCAIRRSKAGVTTASVPRWAKPVSYTHLSDPETPRPGSRQRERCSPRATDCASDDAGSDRPRTYRWRTGSPLAGYQS